MTLHWWMHWFWVTLLTILIGSSVSLAAPHPDQLQHITTGVEEDVLEHFERQGRAMYFSKTSFTTTVKSTTPSTNSTTDEDTKLPNGTQDITTQTILNATRPANITIVHPSVVEDKVNETANATVKTEHEGINITDVKDPVIPQNKSVAPNTKKRINLTRHPEIKELDRNIEGAAESNIVTEKTLSLETTFLQTRIPPNIESSRRVIDQPSNGGSGMDTGEIAGISFAALVLAALAGSTAFVLYRRRYLNKPQTLNDKCSNPDSSGYLDDSTVRDNSEEMYSLDNDSFLNSLEAMTIQNYWTDTVKHTKL